MIIILSFIQLSLHEMVTVITVSLEAMAGYLDLTTCAQPLAPVGCSYNSGDYELLK